MMPLTRCQTDAFIAAIARRAAFSHAARFAASCCHFYADATPLFQIFSPLSPCHFSIFAFAIFAHAASHHRPPALLLLRLRFAPRHAAISPQVSIISSAFGLMAAIIAMPTY
jgi:hypothetical protein